MCGIIGYIGKKNRALPIILDGLKNLEYRGYDSAGIAYEVNNQLNIIKVVGQISELEKKVDFDEQSCIGIGHTRWATHGAATEDNSHPHSYENITLVHNGIIENYAEIKEKFLKAGVKFKSDTDSEVAAVLLNSLYFELGDILKAILKFKEIAKGSYAIAFILKDNMDELYVIKNSSPLIIGTLEDENLIASDVPAILKYTSNYVLLDDGEFAKINAEEIFVYDVNGKIKDITVKSFEGDNLIIDKKDFEHYMLKEIHDEPDILKGLLDKHLKNLNGMPDLKLYKTVNIVACGSAMHAGIIGKYLIEKNLNIPVSVEIASEFRYKTQFLDEKDLVIAISQSGETADTLAAVKLAKACGAHTLGIVNVKESSIAREVDEVLYIEAGSEIAVATTKAYVAQLMILILLSLRRSKIYLEILEKLPLQVAKLINMKETYERIAQSIKESEHMFFIGRLEDYALCMEASLKMKEISYIHSEAYAAGELKHGTISLIDNGTVVFAIVTNEGIAEKTISNIKEVKARGAHVVLIISEDINIISDCYDEKIVIPFVDDNVKSILGIVPLQLIAYEVAKLRGCSIDKPKNLAKSVTVE